MALSSHLNSKQMLINALSSYVTRVYPKGLPNVNDFDWIIRTLSCPKRKPVSSPAFYVKPNKLDEGEGKTTHINL